MNRKNPLYLTRSIADIETYECIIFKKTCIVIQLNFILLAPDKNNTLFYTTDC